MNRFHLVLMAACLSIVCAPLLSGVYALEQNDLTTSASWTSDVIYLGDNVLVSIFIVNHCSDEITIYYMGIHADWMETDKFLGYDLSDDPVIISGYGSYTFGSVTLTVPANASAGEHSYFIGIDGLQGASTSFTWDSTASTVIIQDSENAYNSLAAEVNTNITAANNANYQSSDAKSFLEQAEATYTQALSLADEENWGDAILFLQSAVHYLEEASTAEQNYVEADNPQTLLLLALGGVAAVVIVAVVVMFFRSGKKGNQSAPVEQPAAA